tara:strand:- start:13913 stop:14437 length:525 start_codon:yes stop_codon:yes gene_type:complete
MKTLIFSTTHHKQSKPDAIAKFLTNQLQNDTIKSHYIHVGDLNLPMCDGYECYKNETVIKLQKEVNEANSFIICSPIYNYDLNAIAKNLIELCGQGFRDKVIGLAVTAGGQKSYMAPLSFINSLLIDYRCIIVPRYVYATSEAFNEDNTIIDETIQKRLTSLAESLITITQKLQ